MEKSNVYPVLAIVGYGRAGKDTAAEYLRSITNLKFDGGSSWTARQYMATRLSTDLGRLVTPEEAYERRHEDRQKWYTYLNEYRKDDPTRLIRDCLQHSDIVCGIRDRLELLAGKYRLIDLVIWIDRDVPVDPTVTFCIDDADIIVRNHLTKDDFYNKLYRLADTLGLLKKGAYRVTS